MPVQFICPKCQKLLSVGSRKIGCQVQCPKCATGVMVPSPEQAAADVAVARAARDRLSLLEVPITELLSESFEAGIDLPFPTAAVAQAAPTAVASKPVEALTSSPVVVAPRPGPVVASTITPQMAVAPISESGSLISSEILPSLARTNLESLSFEAHRPTLPMVPPPRREMIMISRVTLYVQALLFCLVAGIAFAVGYGFGRTSTPATAAPLAPIAAKDSTLKAEAQPAEPTSDKSDSGMADDSDSPEPGKEI
jgi:phage FluMu protein Com